MSSPGPSYPLVIHVSASLAPSRYLREFRERNPQYYIGTWGALIAKRLQRRFPFLSVEAWRADWNIDSESKKVVEGLTSRLFPMRYPLFNKTVTLQMLSRLWRLQWKRDLIINYHGLFGLLPTLLPILFPRARIVLFHHGGLPYKRSGLSNFLKYQLFRLTKKRIALLTYLNPVVHDFLLGEGLGNRMMFLPVGADYQQFGKISRSEARKKLGLNTDQIIGAYIGSISTLKGVDHIVSAYRSLESKEHFNIMLIGPLTEDEYDLYETASGLGFIMPGAVEWYDVHTYLSAADFYVHPIFEDRVGFDVSLMEALATDLPVISSRLGLLDIDISGIGVALNQPEDLKSALEHMIEHCHEYHGVRDLTISILDSNTAIPDRIYAAYQMYCGMPENCNRRSK